MYADFHTYYSDDSKCPMEDMVKKAIEIGLDEICFTEHVDYGIKTDLNCDYKKYFEEAEALREKYKEKITIKIGIEFGVQTHTVAQFELDVKKYPFDFIINSNHQVDNMEFWNYEFQKGKSQKEYQTAYYEAIYEVVKKYKDYSVLGHLDMIKRYDSCGDYPDEKIMPIVDKILRQVIQDGKGIEVNTSSFKYGLKDLTPSRAILRRYYELGGECITIGSDSHETEHLADHIKEVCEELKQIGFKKFCTYDKMQPIFWEL